MGVYLSTMILCVSRVFDTPKMFTSQRLNDCLGMGMGIYHVGTGGNGNVKSHSRSSLNITASSYRQLADVFSSSTLSVKVADSFVNLLNKSLFLSLSNEPHRP